MAERPQRRLAAIVATDVAGYSRLIGRDEEGTLAALRAMRSELIEPLLAEHGGRVANTAGDSLLLEFASAVQAVRWAIAIQKGLADRNVGLPEDRHILLRVGINVGDVVVQDDDLLGDGVNVAARLQEVAAPGTVVVSERVHDDIDGRLEAIFDSAGEKTLKNIARPVRAWQWSPRAVEAMPPRPDAPARLPLPDKPSIAVLPFENMSRDPEQEYFGDGIAEDIISMLSRLPWFFVIARNSTFAFKGRATDVRQLARELGVQYVLEGSVRKAGNRVRITAQLVDARNDRHLWAEHYDRTLDDIFAVQDELAEKIVGEVAPKYLAAEMHRARRKDPQNLDAWDLFLQARWHRNRFERESNLEAQHLLHESIKLDPGSDLALGELALALVQGIFWGWAESPQQASDASAAFAERALAINEYGVSARCALAITDLFAGKHDDAVRRARKAVELAPNSAEANGYLGGALVFAGEAEDAVAAVSKAIRLSPRDPLNASFYTVMQLAAFFTGRYDEVIEWSVRNLQENPNAPPGVHRPMAAAYALLGRMDEARAAIEQLQRRLPGITISATRRFLPIRRSADMERLLDGLRKAGLPE